MLHAKATLSQNNEEVEVHIYRHPTNGRISLQTVRSTKKSHDKRYSLPIVQVEREELLNALGVGDLEGDVKDLEAENATLSQKLSEALAERDAALAERPEPRAAGREADRLASDRAARAWALGEAIGILIRPVEAGLTGSAPSVFDIAEWILTGDLPDELR